MDTLQEENVRTDIATQEIRPPEKLTAAEIRANVNLIQQVLKAVMKRDVHFGVVPGCGDKPTLLKPGAEYIMATFRLSGEPMIEDLSTGDEIRYRVRVRVTHQISRNEIGWGVGEASSNETKYKWIKADMLVWKDTPEDRRREIWKQGKEKPYKVMQVRANMSDVANTVLKMAKKRALVDATLTCTAASDVFNQDIEDLPEGLRENVAAAARPAMPQRASEKVPPPVADDNDSVEDPPEPPIAQGKAPMPEGSRIMESKIKGGCGNAQCGRQIQVGESIVYSPAARRAYHRDHFA